MKKKILAVTVMSIILVAGLVGIAKAIKAPSSYVYSYLTSNETLSYCPRFSPNGKWIAYHTGVFTTPPKSDSWKKVVVQRIDDPSESTRTTVFDTEDYPGDPGRSWAGIPVWTPNGKSIYFWYGYGDPTGWHEFIYAVDIKIKGNNVYVLGEPYAILDGGTGTDWPVENFDISPNGKFLVFWRIEVTRADLYLVPRRLDGTFNIIDRIQLTDTDNIAEYEPRFSPNGKEIVFFSGEGPAHPGYWVEVISIDDLGNPVAESRRTVIEDASWPFWSPDGKHLGITKRYQTPQPPPSEPPLPYYLPTYDIWVIDSDTGDFLWQVTYKSGDPGEKTSTGDWSPTDWNSIVFRKVGSGVYYGEAQH